MSDRDPDPEVAELAALDAHRYLSLVTFRRNGQPVATPVWFARHGRRLYVFTAASSWKVKRLRNDARIRVAPCGPRGAIRGEWIDGRGIRRDDTAIERTAYAALRAKYGLAMRVLDFFSKLSGRIDQRAILELELEVVQAQR